MGLTVEEASAVNDVLDWALKRPRWDGAPVSSTTARDAAGLLADHAQRRLMAGITSADVVTCWPTDLPPGNGSGKAAS